MADKALYLAKEQGRNRVVMVGQPRAVPRNSQLLRSGERADSSS